jgi:hypothetical protein
MDEKSTGRMVIPQLMDEEFTGGIVFRRELQVPGRGIYPRKGIPPRSTSSLTLIQTGKIRMSRKSSKQ